MASKAGNLRLSVIQALAAAALIVPGPALAQAGGERDGRALAPVSTPIPEGDAAAAIKDMGLVESEKPVREMIPNWKKPRKIIVYVDNNTNRIAWLQEVAPGVKLVPVHNQAEVMAEIGDADAQIAGTCSKAVLRAGKALHWIQQSHTGVEGCFSGEMPQSLIDGTVVVTNNKRVHGTPIADHAIAMMMTLSRGLDLYARMNKEGHFGPVPPERMWEIQGKTMLVVGLGGIGTDVARMAHALGMKVIATRNSSHQGYDFVEYVGLSGELPDLIGKADVVVVATPLTPETKGLFNAAMFARMKKGAYFINVTRDGEVVTPDLEAALRSGQLGGAGIDCEPVHFPDNDPIFSTPNIIVTPHVASTAPEADDSNGGEGTWLYMRENLRRYVNGDKLYSVVDPKLGY